MGVMSSTSALTGKGYTSLSIVDTNALLDGHTTAEVTRFTDGGASQYFNSRAIGRAYPAAALPIERRKTAY
jgi:hypothetical protein